ncbi:two-component system sensor histidine kinase RstB [Enterobacteriaceae bacterium BIT-l23]|uniref:two-component system sensor histidine kinase RstB n=1 Tax=Jejubacter sp. L23 TaxID=3092086 RepID=UPI001584502F|nr:two-component system sensor histidine kinase RstB [Enterobacteriaceae bacterium BIT-l23]
MRKLFIQFYLLLFVCFLVMSMLVGLVYKFTAERAGRQSLDDLMKSSLYMVRSELREIPPRDWAKTLDDLDLNLSFTLSIEPLKSYDLTADDIHRLRDGDIVALDDRYTFIQLIPDSRYVLSAGPVPYLFFLHEMRLLDVGLIAFIAISLAFPVFVWMRPHWQDMLKLETAAQRFGQGHLDARLRLEENSSLARMGLAFNQMADNINTLVASKKRLIDDIAHELRTPLVRLRYRLAMSDDPESETARGFNRDIGQLEALIDELLAWARLDRPQPELLLSPINLNHWLEEQISEARPLHPERAIKLALPQAPVTASVDPRLISRALDNLVNNALRYSREQVQVTLKTTGAALTLCVEDDGPGVPEAERQHIFDPFVRLDPSRDRNTGGCGLGLAIVHSIATAFGGSIRLDDSPLGGARFSLEWPIVIQDAKPA